MKIDIRTLRKTKGFGNQLEKRVLAQHKLDNNIQMDTDIYILKSEDNYYYAGKDRIVRGSKSPALTDKENAKQYNYLMAIKVSKRIKSQMNEEFVLEKLIKR